MERILKNLDDARGGLHNLAAVESARISGRYVMTGAPATTVKMEWKRPNRLRLEIGGSVEGYDGETAWLVPPDEGRARRANSDEAAGIRRQADLIDGPLVDWKAKGNRVTYLGPGELDGAAVRKLGLRQSDGTELIVFLDAESFLPVRRRGTERLRSEEIEIETYLSDYRRVGELMIAHTIKTELIHEGLTQWFYIEAIELNVPIPDERFAFPARAPF